MVTEQDIIQAAEAVVGQHGLQLVDITVHAGSGSHGGQLRLAIGPGSRDARVGTSECAEISRQLGTQLEQEGLDGFFQGRYALEVSTPGLTRKLKSERELQYGVGFPVRVRLRENMEVDGRPENAFTGVLEAVEEDALRFRLGEDVVDVPRGIVKVVQLNMIESMQKGAKHG